MCNRIRLKIISQAESSLILSNIAYLEIKLLHLVAVNISQIKHTWFSFDFLFVTDLSNYNAVVFTGKRCPRMEGIQAFILSMKRNHRTKVPQRI